MVLTCKEQNHTREKETIKVLFILFIILGDFMFKGKITLVG